MKINLLSLSQLQFNLPAIINPPAHSETTKGETFLGVTQILDTGISGESTSFLSQSCSQSPSTPTTPSQPAVQVVLRGTLGGSNDSCISVVGDSPRVISHSTWVN